MSNAAISSRSVPVVRRFGLASALLAAAGLAALSGFASGHAYSVIDLRIATWVKGIELPGLHAGTAVANFLTDAPMAVALWVVAMTLFVLRGRPLGNCPMCPVKQAPGEMPDLADSDTLAQGQEYGDDEIAVEDREMLA